MKKNLLLLVIILSFQSLKAQYWCTPGSEWHFDHKYFNNPGYRSWKYLYDTTIAGNTCNKIKVNSTVAPTNWPVTQFINYVYTYSSNKVVYIKDVTQLSNSFDTLFNFNAAIGDKWRMAPVSRAFCAAGHVIVLDTGNASIQGQTLHWLKVNYLSASKNSIDTIFERLGALNVFPYWPDNICPGAIDGEEGGQLRCFSDSQITGYKHAYTNDCNYYPGYNVGLATPEGQDKQVRMFPNPATDALTIEAAHLSGRDCTLQLTDLLGRVIFSQAFDHAPVHLNMSKVQSGIYLVKLKEGDELRHTHKIIRQ